MIMIIIIIAIPIILINLGPVHYLLYTVPLAKVIRSYGLDYHLYADDTQLYFAFKSVDVDATKSRVENCISAICR